MKRMISVVAAISICLGLGRAVEAYAQKEDPAQEQNAKPAAESSANILITGIVVNTDGSPLTGKMVFYALEKDKKKLDWGQAALMTAPDKDGKEQSYILHKGVALPVPHDKTDSEGRFTIQVPLADVGPRAKEAEVYLARGLHSPVTSLAKVKLDVNTKNVDIGKVTAK